MDYKRIIIIPDGELNDQTCDIALELGAVSASIETVDPEAPWFHEIGEPFWENLPPAQLTCVLPKNLKIENFVDLITHKSSWGNIPTFRVEDIEDKDWSRVGRDDFGPIMITNNLWIVPTWHEPEHSDAVNIRLDPGLAFGSGTHATTRLCLEWLAKNIKGNESVMDYGCGSGILAIAAKLLGATMVHGTDIDPQAMQSATMNAELNNVNISLFESDQLENTYDIVIANILAGPLKTLSNKISSLTNKSGKIVLSGIMIKQSIDVQKAYSSDFSFKPIDKRGDWVLLEGIKIR